MRRRHRARGGRERERKRNLESGGVRSGDAGGYQRDDKGRRDGGREAHGEKVRVPKLNIDINKQIMGARGASELCILIEAQECGGASICPHQRQRSRCKECREEADTSMPAGLEELAGAAHAAGKDL